MSELDHIIRTAVHMETDGIDFYQKVADKSSFPAARDMFLSFKKDEARHLRVLQEIMQDLGFSDFDQYFGEPPRERIRTVFTQVEPQAGGTAAATPGELDALRVGLEMEDKSIQFYRDALHQVQSETAQGLLRRLIPEEQDHYQILQNTLSLLENRDDWFLWDEKAVLDGG